MALSNRTPAPATTAEARAAEGDRIIQERAAAAPQPMPRTSPGYVRAVNPDGVEVTFVPGEALPRWAAESFDAGSATFDPDAGVWTLSGRTEAAGTSGKSTGSSEKPTA